METRTFNVGGYYHLYNRGVDKRNIFADDHDRCKFINYLSTCNRSIKTGKPLVSMVSYCLMDNHFHFLIRQEANGGISKFMQRFGNSYTKYFNARHERSGSLFESTYKDTYIDSDEQLLHTSRYIHLNSLSFLEPNWKVQGLQNIAGGIRFLQHYPWSSCPRYLGKQRNPLVISEPITELLPIGETYQMFVESYLRDRH